MKHRMSRLQRAKQFMPFAALKGFEALLSAVARPKESRVELSENQIEEVNKVLQIVRSGDWVRIVYYDKHKYTELIGPVEVINKRLQLLAVQGVEISFRDIKAINLYDMTT
ncbi:hypothetical protein [uncultured Veillonella sp.]|uniref:hypothetical protein n=1 Tax=uncultured Veillonella sp. TaxID=159268 RepID=UPI002658C2FB|nr:hypothetical protein [uncultured Veillonella sp.]